MPILDPIDIRILEVLQNDGRIANQNLASLVNLSPSPCWRRVKRLEDDGMIQKYVTLLNPQNVGLTIIAYANVSLENHHPRSVEEFDTFVASRPEIMECNMVSGEFDYLLRLVATDMSAYERFLSDHLMRIDGVRSVNTTFVLKQKKYSTGLNLNF